VFVCLGNICRSPVAEAVFRDVVKKRGLESCFIIDSAGTGSWHVGEPPDGRMRRTAEGRGISMENMFARQFTEKDFGDFDHIFAMDRDNLNDILYLDPEGRGSGRFAGDSDRSSSGNSSGDNSGNNSDSSGEILSETDSRYKVRLFREADPEPGNYQVPDPYYGGADGFTDVFDMVTRTSEALVDAFESEFDLQNCSPGT